MRSNAETVEEYIGSIDEKWKDMIVKLRDMINENIPDGFEERMSYGMPGWVIPHSIYPDGYHVKPEDPLPFINLAAQKNNISLYHMGIYDDEGLLDWFTKSYKEEIGKKPNMGKSCIRFKKEEEIPYGILEELFRKVTVDDHIRAYEKAMQTWKKSK